MRLYDVMPESVWQRSGQTCSRSPWYFRILPFPKTACNTQGSLTSRKAWTAKAVSHSWDPFVPWKKVDSSNNRGMANEKAASACSVHSSNRRGG